MRPYLNNFIQTLSHRRQERVSDLLEEARTGKEQLETLMERLDKSASGGSSSLVLSRHRRESLIGSSPVVGNIVAIRRKIEELFDVSNTIAVLLSSSSAMLASEVRAIEDELLEMEKMVFNFAFLLSDNQAYHYAFLEPFNDELNRDSELEVIPDRSSLPFGPADNAFVNKKEGELSIPESTLNSHGMSVELIKGNATAFTIDDSGINNVLTAGASTGWKKTVLTGGPITSPLAGYNRNGAQAILEFQLAQPAPCSEIKLTPYADLSIEILQITTFADEEDSQGTNHLDRIHRLDRPYLLHFPMQSVYKFHVVLNQPTYHRVTKRENVLEFRYNRMIERLNDARKYENDVYKRMYSTSKIEQSLLLETMGKGQQSVSLPATDLGSGRGPMDVSNLVMAFQFNRPSLWKKGGGDQSYIMFNILQESDNNINDIRRNGGDFEISKNTRQLATDSPIAQLVDSAIDSQIVESGYTYYYNLGLHYVGIGVESPGFKGVYVSKPLPAPGDIGVIRIKSKEENYFIPNSARHSSQITSVEYSVSNRSNPVNEIDWHPILPVGTRQVMGERMFLDDDGRGYFRFRAASHETISIYRNGYSTGFGGNNMQILRGKPGTVIGIKLNLAAFSPEDIITCDYYPADDVTTLSFEGENYEAPPLVAAHDENGAGERFFSTADRNTVTLGRKPYIDPHRSQQSGFQPIIVQLDDGNVPQNLTDYINGRSVHLPSEGYYFTHSGNTLMFNRPITTPFRVYYDYPQNNVRFRTVLRCNHRDFVSPKVDYVHSKAKIREADVRSI